MEGESEWVNECEKEEKEYTEHTFFSYNAE